MKFHVHILSRGLRVVDADMTLSELKEAADSHGFDKVEVDELVNEACDSLEGERLYMDDATLKITLIEA